MNSPTHDETPTVTLTDEERRMLAREVLGGASPSSLMVRAVERIVAARVAQDRRAAAARIRAYAEGYYDSGQAEGFAVAAKIAEGWLRR